VNHQGWRSSAWGGKGLVTSKGQEWCAAHPENHKGIGGAIQLEKWSKVSSCEGRKSIFCGCNRTWTSGAKRGTALRLVFGGGTGFFCLRARGVDACVASDKVKKSSDIWDIVRREGLSGGDPGRLVDDLA